MHPIVIFRIFDPKVSGFFRLAILISFTVGSAFVSAQCIDRNFQDGKIIFKLKANQPVDLPFSPDSKGSMEPGAFPFLNNLIDRYGICKVVQKFFFSKSKDLKRIYEVQFNKLSDVDQFVNDLRQIQLFDYCEKEALPYAFEIPYKPNDVYYDTNQTALWHLYQINADSAWGISKGDSTVIVAVVDNYICTTNPDLSSKLVKGWDVADNDSNTNEPSVGFNDHGTHVAGIVGAATDNKIGVASIGFNIKVMPVKDNNDITNNSGGEPYGYQGVVWAAEHGARVINMSWGGIVNDSFTHGVIRYADSLGCILVAASGDDGTSKLYYPASFDSVISVGATGKGDTVPIWSTHNSQVAVSAPGNFILSTISHHLGQRSGIMDYDIYRGTSMSSPMVAGLCGLMLSERPTLTYSQVRTCLVSTCDNISSVNPGVSGYGAGRINAYKALKCADTITVLGIKEIHSFDFKVFPNPSSGRVTVEIPSGFNDHVDLKVYNSVGMLVASSNRMELINGVYQFDLSAENTGIYFIECKTNKGVSFKKVILY